MDAFRTLLSKITAQPLLYVGVCSLQAVSHYLEGYSDAVGALESTERPLHGWQRWIELRFLIFSAAWSWKRILMHVYGSDAEALKAMPGLYDEFVIQRAAVGVEGIAAELERKLIAEYGEDWHVPETTNTNPDSQT